MDSLLPGIVGGIFSLLAIWLQNHLKTGKQDTPPPVADTPPVSGERRSKLRRMALLTQADATSGRPPAPEPLQAPAAPVAVTVANIPAAEEYQTPAAEPVTTSKASGIGYIRQGLIVFAVDCLIFLFGAIFFGGETNSTLHTWFAMFVGMFIPIYASGLIIFGGYSVLRSWLRGRVQ